MLDHVGRAPAPEPDRGSAAGSTPHDRRVGARCPSGPRSRVRAQDAVGGARVHVGPAERVLLVAHGQRQARIGHPHDLPAHGHDGGVSARSRAARPEQFTRTSTSTAAQLVERAHRCRRSRPPSCSTRPASHGRCRGMLEAQRHREAKAVRVPGRQLRGRGGPDGPTGSIQATWTGCLRYSASDSSIRTPGDGVRRLPREHLVGVTTPARDLRRRPDVGRVPDRRGEPGGVLSGPPAATTSTRAPASSSRTAAVSPMIPAPSTTTRTSTILRPAG